MKRKPIPQHEFSFAGEAFNLAGQTQQAAPSSGPVIMAEMSEAERERLRADLQRDTFGDGLSAAGKRSLEVYKQCMKANGFTPDRSMRKALATMQGGKL